MRRVVACAVLLLALARASVSEPVKQIVPLKHLDPATMAGRIMGVAQCMTDVKPNLTTIQLEPNIPANALVVTAEAEQLELLRKVITALDQPTSSVAYRARFIKTMRPDQLLGVPGARTVTIDGKPVAVPGELFQPRPEPGGAAGIGGGGRGGMGGMTPQDMYTPICNPNLDAAKLAELLESKQASEMSSPGLVTPEGTFAYVGFGPGGARAYGSMGDGGMMGPMVNWLAFTPTIREDGKIVTVARFASADPMFGAVPLSIAWIADSGVPVALGRLPLSSGTDAVVIIVTAEVVKE